MEQINKEFNIPYYVIYNFILTTIITTKKPKKIKRL